MMATPGDWLSATAELYNYCFLDGKLADGCWRYNIDCGCSLYRAVFEFYCSFLNPELEMKNANL